MKTYKLLEIWLDSGIKIRTGETQVFEWLRTELEKHLPFSFRFDIDRFSKYSCHIHKLQDKDYEIMWWIMKRLGESSWEPFAVYNTSGGTSNTYRYYCFRQEVESS